MTESQVTALQNAAVPMNTKKNAFDDYQAVRTESVARPFCNGGLVP